MNIGSFLAGVGMGVSLTLILCSFTITPVYGHERILPTGQVADASWIERHYPRCCGPQDCKPVDRSAVQFTDGRWSVDGIAGTVDDKQVRLSLDGKTWRCINLYFQTLRCIFLPGGV